MTATRDLLNGSRSRWAMRDLVIVVVLAVVFGFVYWAMVQAWQWLAVLMGPAGDLAQHVLFGSWLIVAPLALAIVRRPMAGVVAELLAALVEVVFLGSPVGPVLLVSAALQGFGCELPFLVTRYRRVGWQVFLVSGALGAALVFWFSAARLGWYGQDILLLRFVVQVASGVVLGGAVAAALYRGLLRTGVLDNYAGGHRDAERATAG